MHDNILNAAAFEQSNSNKDEDHYSEVKGRLNSRAQFWETIGAPAFIVDSIKYGYKILFILTPVLANWPSREYFAPIYISVNSIGC